jgi:hypothetical protein
MCAKLSELYPTPTHCVQKVGCKVKDDSQVSRFNVVYPVGFWTYLGTVTFFSFLVLSFGRGIFIPCLPHHCVLEVHNSFDSSGSELESNLTKHELSLEFLPISNVEENLD